MFGIKFFIFDSLLSIMQSDTQYMEENLPESPYKPDWHYNPYTLNMAKMSKNDKSMFS